jgi:hypothetical protein
MSSSSRTSAWVIAGFVLALACSDGGIKLTAADAGASDASIKMPGKDAPQAPVLDAGAADLRVSSVSDAATEPNPYRPPACGAAGQSCCAGNACNDGGCCLFGVCVGSGAVCPSGA